MVFGLSFTDAQLTMATGQSNTDAAIGVAMVNHDRFHTTALDPFRDRRDRARRVHHRRPVARS